MTSTGILLKSGEICFKVNDFDQLALKSTFLVESLEQL